MTEQQADPTAHAGHTVVRTLAHISQVNAFAECILTREKSFRGRGAETLRQDATLVCGPRAVPEEHAIFVLEFGVFRPF